MCRRCAGDLLHLGRGDRGLARGRCTQIGLAREVLEEGDAGGRPAGDGLVHDGLGEAGLVGLVVPQLAVAPHVDDDVPVEGLAEVDRQIDRLGQRLGVLAVDVDDRDGQHPGDVGGVVGGIGVARAGGEADLVVDDDVHGAAHVVGVEPRHVERLGHHALAGEGGVAVEQDGQAVGAPAVADAVLLAAHAALHDGVDPLEVAGVEGQRDVHPARRGHPVARVAQVVLDVAARVAAQVGGAVEELGEDLGGRLAQHVGQHVEAPAVGHADDDLGDAGARGALDEPVEQGDDALGALEREALGPQELGLQKLLEHLGLGHPGQQLELLGARELDPVAGRLHPALQPAPYVVAVDVGQLDADVAAVGLVEQLDQLAQADRPALGDALGLDQAVEIRVGDAVVGQAQPVGAAGAEPQRVEGGRQVAHLPIVLDQAAHPLAGDRPLGGRRGQRVGLLEGDAGQGGGGGGGGRLQGAGAGVAVAAGLAGGRGARVAVARGWGAPAAGAAGPPGPARPPTRTASARSRPPTSGRRDKPGTAPRRTAGWTG